MNWEAVGAVGEITGAAAVVITLIYLAAQVRAGRAALRTTIRDSAFNQLQAWNYHLVADDSLALLFHRGVVDPADLDPRERARFGHAAYSFLKVFENIYLHYLDGTVTEDVWDGSKEALNLFAALPGMRSFWDTRRSLFDPRFGSVVDRVPLAPVPELEATDVTAAADRE